MMMQKPGKRHCINDVACGPDERINEARGKMREKECSHLSKERPRDGSNLWKTSAKKRPALRDKTLCMWRPTCERNPHAAPPHFSLVSGDS